MSNLDQNHTIGIVGGGQLGRMLIQSGIDWNISFRVLDPDADAPCSTLSFFSQGKLTDYDTLLQFGRSCDLITIEIENVNVEALKQLVREGKKVFPQPEVIELIQDKRKQKVFYRLHQIPTAEFVLVEGKQDVYKHQSFLPAVNKLGKEGYDGKGVQVLRSTEDLTKAFDAPGLLEKLIDFEKEIAIIVARNEDGSVVSYPPVEMVFHPEANLVEYLFAPAKISEETMREADRIARHVISELNMVGLLAVEMFVTKNGGVLVNEVAPRPHNSGHQTIEGNVTSQYQQCLRAILNLPLGDCSLTAPSAMVNLLGEEGFSGVAKYEGFETILNERGMYVHLYGKKKTKPFRKMGHITIVDHDPNELTRKVSLAKKSLKVKA